MTSAPKSIYKLKAKIWLYPGDAAWHFVTIDQKPALQIKKDFSQQRRGFGSIPVAVTLGKSVWKTSIFPTKDGTYLLPLKASVRSKEAVARGDNISFTLNISL